MKCQLHWEREAASVCKDCGAPLCTECSSRLGNYCSRCAEKMAQEGKKEILTTFGISVIAFLFGIWMVITSEPKSDPLSGIIGCLLCFFLPFGWKAVSKISDYFLVLASAFGFLGWVLYIAIKLGCAFSIGWILGIPKMIEMIKLWKIYVDIERIVKDMKMVPKSRVVD